MLLNTQGRGKRATIERENEKEEKGKREIWRVGKV